VGEASRGNKGYRSKNGIFPNKSFEWKNIGGEYAKVLRRAQKEEEDIQRTPTVRKMWGGNLHAIQVVKELRPTSYGNMEKRSRNQKNAEKSLAVREK